MPAKDGTECVFIPSEGPGQKQCVMKTIIYLLASCLILTSAAFAQSIDLPALKGKWLNKYGAGIEISGSSQMYVVYAGEKREIVSYEADFSKSPAWFDFTVKHNDKVVKLKSLIYLLEDDLLKWQIFESESRPAYFTLDKGETLYLKRIKTLLN